MKPSLGVILLLGPFPFQDSTLHPASQLNAMWELFRRCGILRAVFSSTFLSAPSLCNYNSDCLLYICAAWWSWYILSQDFFFSPFVTNVGCQSVGDKCDLKRAGIGLWRCRTNIHILFTYYGNIKTREEKNTKKCLASSSKIPTPTRLYVVFVIYKVKPKKECLKNTNTKTLSAQNITIYMQHFVKAWYSRIYMYIHGCTLQHSNVSEPCISYLPSLYSLRKQT